MPDQEEGNPLIQEEEEEWTPPKQRALPAHGMQGRGRTQNPTDAPRRPPDQHALPEHGMQGRGGEGGAESSPKERGATPLAGAQILRVQPDACLIRRKGTP